MGSRTDQCVPVPVVAGHPLLASGRGEDARSTFLALLRSSMRCRLFDIYAIDGHPPADFVRMYAPHMDDQLGEGVNVFVVNGNEVEPVLRHLAGRLPPRAYNVVYPAWELSHYPKEWAHQLDRFDEIWLSSSFTYDAVRAATSRPCFLLPFGVEVNLASFLGRGYFGIRESAFTFLFFFDFTSFVERKNPRAVLAAFKKLLQIHPGADVLLVLKLSQSGAAPDERDRLLRLVEEFRDRVLVIDRTLTDNEMKNLLYCCDCFVSLHRAEGFGRGLAECMFLAKPVIATAYSGNLEFMTAENSCLVNYRLVPVASGSYPSWEGQMWADVDVDHAVHHMTRLLHEASYARTVGAVASRAIRTAFSLRAAGLRFKRRLAAIVG